jgi:predicted RNA binding protein YcfA (HicA-like mRNA interferase family)
MPRKLRQLRADLRAAGFALVRQVGSHETWRHSSGEKVTLAGADGDDAQRYQERQVRAARVAVEGDGTKTVGKD